MPRRRTTQSTQRQRQKSTNETITEEDRSPTPQPPKFKNQMMGKNRGITSDWYEPSKLDDLVQQADPGDLLEFDRRTYKHWAMFAGPDQEQNGKEAEAHVIHFDAPGSTLLQKKNDAKVVCEPLKKVVDTNKVRINNLLDTKVWLKPASSIKVYNKRIEEFSGEGKCYNLFKRNCEHFVNYCRYGLYISHQSRIAWVILSILCVDAAVGRDNAPSVIGMRHVAGECEALAKSFLNWSVGESFSDTLGYLAYEGILVVMTIPFLLLLIGFVAFVTFMVSAFRQKHGIYVVIITVGAFFVGIATFSYMRNVGPGLLGVALMLALTAGLVVFGAGYGIREVGLKHYKYSEDTLIDTVCALGLVILGCVLGPAYSLSLIGMTSLDDRVRLRYAASRKTLNSVAYIIELLYLLYVFKLSGILLWVFLVLISWYAAGEL